MSLPTAVRTAGQGGSSIGPQADLVAVDPPVRQRHETAAAQDPVPTLERAYVLQEDPVVVQRRQYFDPVIHLFPPGES